jgi:hypothetical protein
LLPERFPALLATVRKRGAAKIHKAKAARAGGESIPENE